MADCASNSTGFERLAFEFTFEFTDVVVQTQGAGGSQLAIRLPTASTRGTHDG